MSGPRLAAIADIEGTAQLPGYVPKDHGVGIVHIGVGAFHRAHQAVMTDDALAEHGGDWRITGVSLRSTSIARDLNEQNGLYTLIERGVSAINARIIASIDRVIAADAKATLDILCDSGIRVVTLTVTEAGYGIDRDSRLPDTSNKIITQDLAQPSEPAGVLGLLVASIAHRRNAGVIPFSVLSCDNLPENGALLRDGVIGFARHSYSDDLASWIADNIAFPCSMVDRITPAPTDETRQEARRQTGCVDTVAVETEAFSQWIIEDNFPSGRPQWEAGGALFVSDVTPYERMKLMMLNGSHSMLAYAGFLTGKPFVRDVMSDADLSPLVQRHFKSASALLQPLPGVEFDDYASALTARFSNPSIAHETYQIATDGTQKLPQRIFQPALEAIDAHQELRPFAFATAMWMRFCLQRRDDDSRYELHDTRAEEIASAVSKGGKGAANLSDVLHSLPNLIPKQLASNEIWRLSIDEILTCALANGCLATIWREAEAVKMSVQYSESV